MLQGASPAASKGRSPAECPIVMIFHGARRAARTEESTISPLSDPEWVAINTIVEEASCGKSCQSSSRQGARNRRISFEQDRALMLFLEV